MSPPLMVAFVAGPDGPWRIEGISAAKGETLAPAARLAVVEGDAAATAEGRWVLRGAVAGQGEDGRPDQLPLGRPEARCAALLALGMTAAWWDRAEDDRRALSAAIEHGPAISRRLHLARDRSEPFDVLVWFELAPEYQGELNQLLADLRPSDEWSFVERDVDVRLIR